MAYYKKDDPTVYHECRNCTEGNNIEEENLIVGQPVGARLCDQCANLLRQNECEGGTPIPAR